MWLCCVYQPPGKISVCNSSGRAEIGARLIAVAVSAEIGARLIAVAVSCPMQQEILFCSVTAKKIFHPLSSLLCSSYQLLFCSFISHPMHWAMVLGRKAGTVTIPEVTVRSNWYLFSSQRGNRFTPSQLVTPQGKLGGMLQFSPGTNTNHRRI